MELKRLLVAIMGIIFVGVLIILEPICTAQHAIVTIKNVNVELIETHKLTQNKTIHIYNITAVLHNSGDLKSDEISVYLYDPEYTNMTMPSIRLTPFNISLNPGETKTFSLQKWPTTLSGDIPINISFKPSSPNILVTEYNSGYYIYTLRIGNGNTPTSTPGFEILIVFLAILVLLFKKK